MTPNQYYFPQSYDEAKSTMLALARTRSARIQHLDISGSPHKIDVISLGNEKSKNKLLVTSGLHGVEGYLGSSIQYAWLNKLETPNDCHIIILHIINPEGMINNSRWTDENIDLNRNFWNQKPDGNYTMYEKVNHFLNPDKSSDLRGFRRKASWLILKYGFNTLKQAIAQGQYSYPKGIFFGGTHNSPITTTIKEYLQTVIQSNDQVYGIDIHCGLGKKGELSLYLEGLFAPSMHQKMEYLLDCPVVHVKQSGRNSYKIHGGFIEYISQLAGPQHTHMATMELGTSSPLEILKALRASNFYRHHAIESTKEKENAQLAVKAAFCPDDEEWRQKCIEQSVQTLQSFQKNIAQQIG